MKLIFRYFLLVTLVFSNIQKGLAQTTNISGVINNYVSATSVGSQSINVTSSSGFAVGDRVLLIQMKGASIDTSNTSNFGTINSYNNAGNYELLTVSAISSSTIAFTTPLLRTYSVLDLVQLVKVPVYNNVTITAPLTCLPWNGLTGGVVVFEATGNVTLNANIDVTGKGFLGGAKIAGQFLSCIGNTTDFKLPNNSLLSGNKGEGITLIKPSIARGLGALANGGGAGNDVNGGGAGGGNYGLGGHGGNTKCSTSPTALCGGYEGKNCTYSNSNSKIFLGGGGGSGHENDGVSTAGVSGGGIVIIRSGGSILGNGNFINANGSNNTLVAGNDGQGGGGAGGTVLIEACSTSSLNISVTGGNGGTDNFSGPDCHGKGGGGGGGTIWTASTLSYNSFLNGGNPGVFTNAASQCFNTSNGATTGQVGGTLTGLLIPGATSLFSVGSFSLNMSSNCIINNNSTASATVSTSAVSPVFSYTWTNSSGTIVSQTNNTSSLTNSVPNLVNGIYTLTVQMDAPCGPINTQTLNINCSNSIAFFSSPDTVCVNQSFSVSNLSTGATSNYWTFCQSNTNSTPQAINLGNIGFFNGPVFITIAKEGTDYYAFVTNNSSSTLTKLFFGSSLLNVPVATNLGNISGAFPGSLEDIHIEYEAGNWYGIAVGGFGGGESVVRINFGSSLANVPTAVSYGNIGGLNYPQRLKIFKNGSNYYGFTTNRNNNTITRLNFGTSITNVPTGLNMGNIGSLNTPDAIAIINVASNWYGYIINEGSNTITRLDFGNSLLNMPVGTNLGNTGALNGPRGIDMWTECNEVRGLITNRFSNDLLNMSLPVGPTGPVVTTSFGNIAGFSFPHSITRFRSGDTLFAFITNVSNNTLSRIYYPGCVNSSIASSTLTTPPAISYNAPGNYYINVVINEGDITQTNYCKQVTVVASPTVIVSNANICAGSSASITASGANSYSWTSSPSLSSTTGSLVTTTPSTIESYTVTGFIGSCTNTAVSSVTIIPSPSITITPTLSLICSGQTTTLSASGANTYTWNSSLTLSSNSGSIVAANPNSTAIYTVTGTLNTCTNTAVTTVSVIPNPTLTLSPNVSICQGVISSATLTASGASSYSWTNSSSLSSPTGSIVIASPNTTTNYTVTGTNVTCTNTAIVTVSVNPSPSITSTLVTNTSCGLTNGSATVTSLPANNTYTWSSGVASLTNTAVSLASGNYTVTAINGSCITSSVITILSSIPLTITGSTIMPTHCNVNDGSISVLDNFSASSYSWTPSVSSVNNATNLAIGNYSLTITNGTCATSTVFIINQLSGPTAINIVKNNVICLSNGNIKITNVVNGIAPYQYSFNNSAYSTTTNYTSLTQGIYTITVKDANTCLYTQTVSIAQTTINSAIAITTNTPNCESNDGVFIIDSIYSGTPPYQTSFNNTAYTSNTTFEQLSTGIYTLSILDSNYCETSFILTMPENNRDYTLYIPNTFTPNKDKVNDVWYVQGSCLGEFNCLIFNRWGQKISELKDIKDGWDGTYDGVQVPDGVYVYIIEVETKSGTINKTGHITVFR